MMAASRALRCMDRIAARLGVDREAVLSIADPEPGYFIVEGFRSQLRASAKVGRMLTDLDREQLR